MEQNRIIVQGPVEGTIWVLSIPPTSTAVDLTQTLLQGLGAAIGNNTPLQLEWEGGSAMIYRWSKATGIVSETAVTTPTGSASQVGWSKYPSILPVQAESVPRDTTFLIAKSLGGATGTLRIIPAG